MSRARPIRELCAAADPLIINQADLLPYVDFDVSACVAHASRLNPALEVLVVSATTGEGLDGWCACCTKASQAPPAAS